MYIWKTYNSLVRVGSLSDRTMGLDVLEGLVHPSTVASLVEVNTAGAVDQLLLGETDQLAGLKVVLTLQGTSLWQNG